MNSGRVRQWLPLVFRAVAVLVALYPAVRKFTAYGARVDAFAAYGVPWPELAVLLTGVIELVAIVSITAGFAGRLGGGALVAGMLVVFVTAGPNPAAVLVLVASVGIVVLGTGPYSSWGPTVGQLLDETGRVTGVTGRPRRKDRQ
jgi:uncharacterized membrane protein YphA (DoxX/SURF4 family)